MVLACGPIQWIATTCTMPRLSLRIAGPIFVGLMAFPLIAPQSVQASPDALRTRLAQLSAETNTLEVLLESLATGELPGEPPIALDETSRARVIQELAAEERAALLSRFKRLVAEESPANWRSAALEVLGRMAGPRELSLTFDLVGDEPVPDAALREGLHDVLVRLHYHDPGIALELQSAFLNASGVIQDVCLRALDVNPSREALDLFVRCLGAGGSSLDVALLARLGLGWEQRPVWIEETALSRVRDLSTSSTESVAREAISALGHARDTEDAERWIALLDGASPSQARTAHWALRQVTGLELGTRPDPWRTWLAASRKWQTERKDTALQELRGSNRTLVVRALRDISNQKLDRRELASAVSELLIDSDEQVAATAIASLRALDSKAAVLPLLEALEAGDEAWLETCHAALLDLTGLVCEPSAGAWREALGLEDTQP